MTPAPEPEAGTGPRPLTFWLALAPGGIGVAFGIRGLLDATETSELWSVARWLVGGNLAVDLLVSPVACAVAFAAARWVPDGGRGPVQGALIACGVLGAVSYPFVRGYGVTPGEPSFLDRDYGRSLVILWGCAWLVAVAALARRRFSARRR